MSDYNYASTCSNKIQNLVSAEIVMLTVWGKAVLLNEKQNVMCIC